MDYKNDKQRKTPFLFKNKKIAYLVLAIIILVVVISSFWSSHKQAKLAAEKAAVLQEQKAAEALAEEKRKDIPLRLAFFLINGPRSSFAFPSYLQGSFRKTEADNKMTIMYIKNSDYVEPLMYIRYEEKAKLKLAAGEVELKTNSAKYSFAYYFYPVDSYPGPDKNEFSAVQKEFQNSLATFSAS